ncbi:hypothetical protein PIB30_062453 [Stylosanthes scabra]|uniref:Uncharacterized protein n=1 Tax=Stylosanthes scabra TaxID=79078 RepID=A0ABU6UK63_9FABA|nr:hypothetical protein [Stylosanthes scabra]
MNYSIVLVDQVFFINHYLHWRHLLHLIASPWSSLLSPSSLSPPYASSSPLSLCPAPRAASCRHIALEG